MLALLREALAQQKQLSDKMSRTQFEMAERITKGFCKFFTCWQVAPNLTKIEALRRVRHHLHPAPLSRALKEELVLTSTWSVVPWQPKFRALFHCMRHVPQ